MPVDRSFVELNRASVERMEAAAALTDARLLTPVGHDWTAAIVMAHLAFWDRRVLFVLDMTEREGKLSVPELGIVVNDVSLPLWAAVPPRAAAEIALASARAVDARLERYPEPLLDAIYGYNPRWVVRALHRDPHLDEVEAALRA